jgi:hypothetical protein
MYGVTSKNEISVTARRQMAETGSQGGCGQAEMQAAVEKQNCSYVLGGTK